jgi:hypothetical protein
MKPISRVCICFEGLPIFEDVIFRVARATRRLSTMDDALKARLGASSSSAVGRILV